MFLREFTSFVAALLFAVHPIHTEAVSHWNSTENTCIGKNYIHLPLQHL